MKAIEQHFYVVLFIMPYKVDLKALVNEDTLLPMMFPGLRKLGNICSGHNMSLNKIRNIFCVPDTKFVSARNVACAGKRGNICVGNNVSSFARALTSKSVYESLVCDHSNVSH